ncbi:MAG: CsgG/HfaB family protein, partial [Desulfobacterales bacterium]
NVSKLGRYVSDKLTPYFARSKQFSVMERVVIDKVLEEHQFQVSAFVDEESTQEFGKLVGAETMISGTISTLDDAFYFNAKVVGVAHGNLITSIDVEVDRSGRLVALYNANLPRIKKKEFRAKIFRAKGLGIPSVKHKKNPTLARTLAGRAATVDAMRNLAQQIQGAHIDAKTTVRDFMTESDNVTLQVNTYIRGARVISKKEMPDGAVEVEMEVEMPAEFFEKLSANQ